MKYHFVVTKDLAVFGLSLSAGLGLLLVIAGLLGAAVSAEAATVSLLLVLGFVMLVIGFIGWLMVVQPWRHFDDINVPMDTGHGHAAEPHSAEAALVPHDAAAHAVEPAKH